ncbi:MAG: hypothetical protein J6Z11_12660, partial [Candidatus Riflebacteria bacterium]|nr:hypothetical protein [Candidatus Riflebacteria bacterium]
KVEILEPEIFCYGKAIAKVSFSKPVKDIKSMIYTNDISNIRLITPKKKEKETAFPAVFDLPGIEDKVAYSREIDALLTRYSLKNQKQRTNGWLNWQINTGQAKKAGISKISLDEEKGIARITLIKWPEVFLLNKLSIDKPYHIISLGEI